MKNIQAYWDDLKASFWFIPLLIVSITIVVSTGFIFLDQYVNYKPSGFLQYFFSGSADSARSILSTISGAMIGVAGTVFSITLVALTLASNQFGPRLLRNFMYDRVNQVVLGTYISTFVYCLLILNSVRGTEEATFVPTFSILFAIFAAIMNIILLIVFIHHIAVSIQSDHVISDISTSMFRNLEKIFPQKLGEESHYPQPVVNELKAKYSFQASVKSYGKGYLQSVATPSLIKTASEYNLLIKLDYKPGDYLVKGLPIGEIHATEKPEEEIIKEVENSILLGDTRSPIQDAEYSIHQMVEIAVRALSPGVNDPYTAISCIDNIASVMSYLTSIEFPSGYRFDEDGELRLILTYTDFEGMMKIGFTQIRQYSEGNPAVIMKLLEALYTLHEMAEEKEHEQIIKEHADMVYSLAKRSLNESRDLEDARRKFERFNSDNS